MNKFDKKGIIFTIDALVALSIFIAVTIAIYTFLTPQPEVNVQNSAIYMNSENFLRSSDRAENFSHAFKLMQEGNTTGATALINSLLQELPYPAQATLKVYYGGNLVNNLTVNPQSFETSIILRKFLVLTTTENLGEFGLPYLHITAHSSEPATVPFTVEAWSDESAGGVVVTPEVRDSKGHSTGWSIMPPSRTIEFPLPQQPPQILNFSVVIPSNAEIGEYTVYVQATNGVNYMHFGSGHFNILKYGVIELEVGTS